MIELAWLGNWKYRRTVIIDHNDVDDTLSQFPVLVYLSSSSGIGSDDVTSIFDEVGANRKKIAVTKDDGITQLYVEIETWTSVLEKAWLWVSLSEWEISSTVDTIIYIYYDNSQDDNTTYVGDTNSAPAEAVWDSNFKGVWHMRNGMTTDTTNDSTSNDNDGTKKGVAEPLGIDVGKIDGAQLFDGSDDYINVGSIEPTYLTLECWINGGTKDAWIKVLSKSYSNVWEAPYAEYAIGIADNNHVVMEAANSDLTSKKADSTTLYDTGTWFYVTGTADGSNIRIHINGGGAEGTTGCDGPTYSGNNKAVFIGRRWVDDASEPFDGIIDEVRISDIKRADAWIKATYETGRDNFVTYGGEATPPVRVPRPTAAVGNPYMF